MLTHKPYYNNILREAFSSIADCSFKIMQILQSLGEAAQHFLIHI